MTTDYKRDFLKKPLAKTKNQQINIAAGQGVTSTQLKQTSTNYNVFIEHLTAFKVVSALYLDTVTINNEKIKLSQEEAIIHTKKLAKNNLPWFIAGKFSKDKRIGKNLISRSAIVLDLDNYEYNLGHLEASIKSELSKFKYVAYSTASHTPEKPKIRIVLFLQEDIVASTYKDITETFANTLSFKSSIDEASYKPNQFMFISGIIKITNLPEGVVDEKYQPWILQNEGELLKPTDYIKVETEDLPKTANLSTIGASGAPRLQLVTNETINALNAIKTPLEETEEEKQKSLNLTRDEIYSNLDQYQADKLSYTEWLEVAQALHHYYKGSEGGFNIFDEWSKLDTARYNQKETNSKWFSFKSNANPLTFLTVLKRIKDKKLARFDNEIPQLMSLLTKKIKNNILLPVLEQIAINCEGKEEAEFYLLEIKEKTGLGVVRLRELLQTQYRQIHLKKAQLLQQEALDSGKPIIFPINKPINPAFFSGYIEAKPLKHTLENYGIVLKGYNITARRNKISNKDELIIPSVELEKETAAASALAIVTHLCELNNVPKLYLIPDYTTVKASENSYNPIMEWVDSKPWDGVDRLQEWYDTIITKKHFKTEDKELFMRKWAISFMAAMEEPDGVFSKGVLIFQGEQSIGKTQWFKKLLPEPVSEYFLEGATLDPNKKDSIATVTGHAIVELGEMDSTMKRDIAAIKAFLTSKKDTFRPVYARVDSVLPRRTIFCATVNANEFLVDPTGNSRFWTLPVEEILFEHNIDMQQLWAQVLTKYRNNEIWWLDRDEEKILAQYNEQHIKTCPYRELILEMFIIPKIGEEDAHKKNTQLGSTEIYKMLKLTGHEIGGSRGVTDALSRLGAIRSNHDRKFTLRKNPNFKEDNGLADKTIHYSNED